jgi:hypothetical protein
MNIINSMIQLKRAGIIFALSLLIIPVKIFSQPVPGQDENIPYLMVFGNNASTSWGDDDFSQTFFFLIPEDFKQPIFIRVWDPDCGGTIDELRGEFNTQTIFSVYGGKACWSDPDAQSPDPKGNYKSGNLLSTKTFGLNPKYDGNWYTFGPFNPTEGELVPKFGGRVIKVIAEGLAGDDGNMFRYYLSTQADNNRSIEGGKAFAYEYSFRMWDDPSQISHIYPYIDDRTLSVKQSNFDWDTDGNIRIVSVLRRSQPIAVSGEDNWLESEFTIEPEEKNTSLDIQFKKKYPAVKNNNVVIFVRNQYNELLPFVTIPIGGVPKPKHELDSRDINEPSK